MTVQSTDLKIEALRVIEGRISTDWVNAAAAAEPVPSAVGSTPSQEALITDESLVAGPLLLIDDAFAADPLATLDAERVSVETADALSSEQAVGIEPSGRNSHWDATQSDMDFHTAPFSIGDDTSLQMSVPTESRGADLLTEGDVIGRPEFDDGFHLGGQSAFVVSHFTSGAYFGSQGDLMFLDFDSYAKGGNGGGKGKPSDSGDPGSGGGDPGVLSSYTSGPDGGYNIDIDFKGTWTAELQKALIDAADRLSAIIQGDVGDVFFRGKIIDDIRISAELVSIDGDGGILGQAGPTAIRTANYLPATAIMEFDVADADAFNALGLWDDIVLHEMLHSVGFGSIWEYTGDISGAGTANPLFTGEWATLAYNAVLGDGNNALGVPVEQDGGAGTRDSHWDEETFDNEIMTGYIDASNYVSPMTVASLEDIGYATVWDSSDPLNAGTDPLIA